MAQERRREEYITKEGTLEHIKEKQDGWYVYIHSLPFALARSGLF
jgi:hypothetical protein